MNVLWISKGAFSLINSRLLLEKALNVSRYRIMTKTCGAKSGLKIGSLNPKTDLWQI
jgi:hypothetical protein